MKMAGTAHESSCEGRTRIDTNTENEKKKKDEEEKRGKSEPT